LHQRFSTNNRPTGQPRIPNRYVCHNGRNQHRARQHIGMNVPLKGGWHRLSSGTTSRNLAFLHARRQRLTTSNNAVECSTRAGRDLHHWMAMLSGSVGSRPKTASRQEGVLEISPSLTEPVRSCGVVPFTDPASSPPLRSHGLLPARLWSLTSTAYHGPSEPGVLP